MLKKFIALLLFVTTVFTLSISLTSCKKEKDEGKPDFYYVKLEIREYGDIVVKLDRKNAPITVDNFVSLVKSGFYDGLTFHRVISGFMIQGGAPNSSSNTPNTIKGEFDENGHKNNIKHTRGVISMARTGEYNSASSQFFIMHDDAPHLDGKYAAIVLNTALYGNSNGIIYYEQYQAVIEKATLLENYEN